ncbi:MAG: hypothetical protein QG622_1885 [Actinomycetota bacterium]|nr:hypothetical protein [Actinomycetota bacterium]
MPEIPTLRERFNTRRNNLTVLRLSLATTVVVVHSQALRTATQPSVVEADLGQMAVDGFFILSGFLVTGSARRLNSVRRFLWHRALRVLPGFWACLMVTAFVAAPLVAMSQGRSPLSVFTGEDSAVGFVVSNAGLLIKQWGISGLTTAATEPGAMNGSLWSLYYEGMCYVMVSCMILTGMVKGRVAGIGRHRRGSASLMDRRRELLVAGTVAIWITLVAGTFGLTLPLEMGRLMIFMFLMGVLADLYADHIPMDPRLGIGSLALLLVTCAIPGGDYQILGAPALAYLLLWIAVALPVPFQPRNDISYGVYMYHWPILLVLIWAGLDDAGAVIFSLVGGLLTALFATASWVLVERPMMKYRHARWVTLPEVRTRRPEPAGQPVRQPVRQPAGQPARQLIAG